MAASVAGSVVSVAAGLLSGIAMTGVGLGTGVFGTVVLVCEGKGVGGMVAVHRAAWAVNVAFWIFRAFSVLIAACVATLCVVVRGLSIRK